MTAATPFGQARYRRCRQRGFTLLELLVVVFIIGLMSGYVVLSLDTGDGRGGVDRESKRLYGLMRLAAQEAILQGREVGVLIYHDRYEFVLAGLDQWEPPSEGSTLQVRQLPRYWRLELTQEGQVVPPLSSHPKEEEDEEPEKLAPQIIFFSSGEGTAFELRIYSDSGAATDSIKGEESGNLELSSRASQA
ncbi:MAG: type II secretion system minor pseudopilin GspH [Anaerolineae bacterium]|nr:type II secretion system minor pseudopilin GspH [Anaerolineae bacterium]